MIAMQRAVAAEHAMARDQPRHRIAAHRRSDRARRFRIAQPRRERSVGRHLAFGNGEQGFPDLDLEWRAQQVQTDFGFAVMFEDPARDVFGTSGVFDEIRFRPARCHVGEHSFVFAFVAESQTADAFGCRHHQHAAERTIGKTIFDRKPTPALGVFARCHRFDLQRQIVQARRSRQAGLDGRIHDARAARKFALGMLEGEMADEALGADADIAREQALEVERRQAHRIGGIFQPRLLGVARGEEMDGASDAPPVPRGFIVFEVDQFAHEAKVGIATPLSTRFLRAQKRGFFAAESADFRAFAKLSRTAGARNVPSCISRPWLRRNRRLENSVGHCKSTRTQ